MRRRARLDFARSWLDSGADVTLRTYARRHGVDRYTAYDELTMLGVTLPAKDEQWSVRPPPLPNRTKPSRREKREPEVIGGGLLFGWMEWGVRSRTWRASPQAGRRAGYVSRTSHQKISPRSSGTSRKSAAHNATSWPPGTPGTASTF